MTQKNHNEVHYRSFFSKKRYGLIHPSSFSTNVTLTLGTCFSQQYLAKKQRYSVTYVLVLATYIYRSILLLALTVLIKQALKLKCNSLSISATYIANCCIKLTACYSHRERMGLSEKVTDYKCCKCHWMSPLQQCMKSHRHKPHKQSGAAEC